MSDEERVPLLSNRHEQQQDDAISLSSFKQKLNFKQWLKEEWPILRILIATFLWSVAKFGAVGPIVEFYRIFVCSEYYFKHPELIVALDSDSHKLCSISAVEARMSTINVIVTLLSAAASALGLLIFTPLLSKGRKRVLLFGILGCAFTNLPFIILPIGYPFSDQPQALNPEKILILFMVITILAGLLSPEELPLLACRVLLNDRSSAQRRTRNMSWLTISYLIGLSLAPGAVSGLCKILPSLSASSIDHEFFKIGSRVAEHHRLGRPEDSPPIGSPVPTPHQGNNRETDIMPFIVVLIAALVAMLWTWLMIPETAGLRELEDKGGNEQAAADTKAGKSSNFFAALSILAPRKSPTGSTSRDWRLLQIALIGQLMGSGSLCLDPLVFFVGYSLQWSSTQVNLFISFVGTSRTIVLFLLVPALLALFTRTTKKPQEIASLSKEELDRISKNPIEVENEIEGEEELEESLEHRDENARVSQIYRDERELLRLQEQVEEDSKLRHSLSMWRAQIDLKLLKISILFDLVGWGVTALGGQFLSSALILIGGVMLSLGGGWSAALCSIGVAVATDLHHKGMSLGKTAQDDADAFMGAMSLLDAVAKLWAPLCLTSVYRASLGSVLPGAPFLLATLLCLIALVLGLSFKSDGKKTLSS